MAVLAQINGIYIIVLSNFHYPSSQTRDKPVPCMFSASCVGYLLTLHKLGSLGKKNKSFNWGIDSIWLDWKHSWLMWEGPEHRGRFHPWAGVLLDEKTVETSPEEQASKPRSSMVSASVYVLISSLCFFRWGTLTCKPYKPIPSKVVLSQCLLTITKRQNITYVPYHNLPLPLAHDSFLFTFLSLSPFFLFFFFFSGCSGTHSIFRIALNSQRFICLYFPVAGIKDMYHHNQVSCHDFYQCALGSKWFALPYKNPLSNLHLFLKCLPMICTMY